jgi:hypothetical protein
MTKPGYPDTAMPEADRPWGRPGVVRRDVEPHRGRLILAVGAIAACSPVWTP